MPASVRCALVVLVLACSAAARVSGQPAEQPRARGPDEAALRALGEQYVATQEREDGAALLALWSPGAPTIERQRGMTRFAFRDTDYRFANTAIDRVSVDGDRATLRLIADREVIDSRDTKPDGTRIVRTYRSLMAVLLACVREDGAWRVWEEQSALLPLVEALIEAASDEERERLLAGEERLVSADLRRLIASRADQLYVVQAHDRALSLLRLAERIAIQAGDREGLASAYHNIANIMYLKRQYSEALELYRRRLAIEQDLGAEDGQAEAWLGIATTEYSQGDQLAALESYERALAIREKGGNHAAIADLLVGMGNVRYLTGDYQPALDAYSRAEVLYARAYSAALIAMKGSASAGFGRAQLTRVLQGIGRVRTAQGDYRAAVEASERALDLAVRAEDRPAEANALAILAEVRYRQGQYDLAVELYRKALELAKALGDGDAMGQALAGIGVAELVRGRAAPAAEAYAQAHAAYETQKNQIGSARALVGLGYAQADQQQFKDALGSYDRALAIFTGIGRQEDIARALLGSSMAQAGLGDHDRALDAAVRASAIAASLGHMELAWRAATHVGHANRRLARAAEARAAYESAIATIERLRRDIGEDDAPSFLDDRAEPYLGMVDLAAGAGDAAGALTYAERARAQVRFDLLRRSPVSIDKGLTDEERVEEREVLREIASLATQVARTRSLPKPDQARVSVLQARLAAARERHAAFRLRIDEALPELARWRGEAPPLGGEAAAALVSEAGSLVVEFAVTDDSVHVFALAGGRIAHRQVDIGRKALAARILKAIDPAALGNNDAWRSVARDLSDLLLAPIRDELAGKSLVIVIPDGPLWRVPFEALAVPDDSDEATGRALRPFDPSTLGQPQGRPEPGRGTTSSGQAGSAPTGSTVSVEPAELLIERTAVAYASSMTALQYARDAAAARAAGARGSGEAAASGEAGPRRELLAFAGGSAAPDTLALLGIRSARPQEELDRELDVISVQYGDGRHAVHLGAGSLESHLRDEAAGYAVVHLAAHGVLDHASPLFSSVILGGSSAGPASGQTDAPADSAAGVQGAGEAESADVVQAWELLEMTTGADVIVCSDVEWPAATLQGSDAVTGLSWAWLVAGAPSLVLSRWQAPAPAREILLEELHRGLAVAAPARGPAAALRDAMLRVMRTPGSEAPLNWAGFIMVGEPD